MQRPTSTFSRVAPNAVRVVAGGLRRRVANEPGVRMVPGTVRVGGRRVRFAVSDNEAADGPDGPGTGPVWAVNIHGYFAAGGMYWRESARLAERLGWRVVNPSLAGFGGSDPLEWHEVSMTALADQVAALLDHLGAGPVVLLGHSMGGAVAIQYAHDRPQAALGVIYRDGVATPAWKNRRGVVPSALGRLAPDVAPMADMMAAILLDLPDLMVGRLYSTVRSMLPDVRRNLRTMGRTLPIGTMLLATDLTEAVDAVVAHGIPILSEWGCFDRVATPAAAAEFAGRTGTATLWVPGGHSWMLARPNGQTDVLRHVPAGRAFLAAVEHRHRTRSDRPLLRALS
jgi:pimeloyl-ACP methyl ester carboxylesterase